MTQEELLSKIDSLRDEVLAWLKSLPERFNLQPRTELSEEDKTMINHIIEALPRWANGQITILPSQAEEYVERFKSLMLGGVYSSYEMAKAYVEGQDNILKNLDKYCPSWKPSEEQMRGLAHAINLDVYDAKRYGLDSLYNDLKKLMSL